LEAEEQKPIQSPEQAKDSLGMDVYTGGFIPASSSSFVYAYKTKSVEEGPMVAHIYQAMAQIVD
jgi:hypothetical protein